MNKVDFDGLLLLVGVAAILSTVFSFFLASESNIFLYAFTLFLYWFCVYCPAFSQKLKLYRVLTASVVMGLSVSIGSDKLDLNGKIVYFCFTAVSFFCALRLLWKYSR